LAGTEVLPYAFGGSAIVCKVDEVSGVGRDGGPALRVEDV